MVEKYGQKAKWGRKHVIFVLPPDLFAGCSSLLPESSRRRNAPIPAKEQHDSRRRRLRSVVKAFEQVLEWRKASRRRRRRTALAWFTPIRKIPRWTGKAIGSFNQVIMKFSEPVGRAGENLGRCIERSRGQVKKLRNLKQVIEKSKQELEKTRLAVEESKLEIEKARAELEKSKQEIEKSKQMIEKSRQVDLEIEQKRRARRK
jgi:hypothetical protein